VLQQVHDALLVEKPLADAILGLLRRLEVIDSAVREETSGETALAGIQRSWVRGDELPDRPVVL